MDLNGGRSMDLEVSNLPENRLALSNRVYVSPSCLAVLLDSMPPELSGNSPSHGNGRHRSQSASVLVEVLVGRTGLVFLAGSHPSVTDRSLAMNGLQRRFTKLTLNAVVRVKAFVPPPTLAATTLELGVDLLSRGRSGSGSNQRPKEIDTDRLGAMVRSNYNGQVFTVGATLATDFEGTKLELTVREVSTVGGLESSSSSSGAGAGRGGSQLDSNSSSGQLMEPTVLTFSRSTATGTGTPATVTLVGDAVAGDGGAAGNNIFLKDFDFVKLGIGGLNEEFNEIFRRAFASRIWPQRVIQQLGIHHVRGMLLYGPPGCGKTLIARQIGKVLNARPPKIVNGPEILNKYVGGSEEKIRELFAEAEQEQAEAGDSSMLHIIILDEMDAICKSRGSSRDSTGVSDSVVNQLLSKIDGVDSLNNILLIGMTNRKDMIDDALLRPGRLEVHVEIGLPDEAGRTQVLTIHTASMRKHGRIEAEAIKRIPELASQTENFSGAELEGLVKAATSFALTRCVDVKDLSKPPDEAALRLQYADFQRALGDVEPKFGAKSAQLQILFRQGFVDYGHPYRELTSTLKRLVQQVRSPKTPLLSVLLHGPVASGKTAVAAKTAADSGFPFVRTISADDMIGFGEVSKCTFIHRVFEDSYKSPLSLILIDDLERVVDYVDIGPRFSNVVLQTLLVLLKKAPPTPGHRLLVLATTAQAESLVTLGLTRAFSVAHPVPTLLEPDHIRRVLRDGAGLQPHDAEAIASHVAGQYLGDNDGIGVKRLLMVAEMAKSKVGPGKPVDVNSFLECLHIASY